MKGEKIRIRYFIKISFIVVTAMMLSTLVSAQAAVSSAPIDYTRIKSEQIAVLTHEQTFYDETSKETFRVINDDRNKGLEIQVTKNGKARFVKHGSFYRFYDGKKTEMVTYHYGVRHGLRETYNKTGVVKFSHYYEKGRKNGPHVQRNDKNQIVSEATYVDGRKHGIQIDYSNEKINFKKNWVDGKLNGEHLQYNSKGKVVARKTYVNGKVVSKTTNY